MKNILSMFNQLAQEVATVAVGMASGAAFGGGVLSVTASAAGAAATASAATAVLAAGCIVIPLAAAFGLAAGYLGTKEVFRTLNDWVDGTPDPQIQNRQPRPSSAPLM